MVSLFIMVVFNYKSIQQYGEGSGHTVWCNTFQYIFFVFLLLAVQFVVSVLALNYKSDIYRYVHSDMEQSMKYHREVFTNSQLTWDKLQEVVS